MNAARALGPVVGSTSLGASPSAKYVGCWLAPKFYAPAGTLTYHLITLSNTGIASNAIAGASSPVAGNASWLVAGVRVRVRNNGGTLPTGLSTSTTYYAGRPDADKVSLHLTEADALAGTSLVAFSGGTSNTDIYAAEWLDVSGQGNHLLIGAANNNLAFYGTSGYGSAASSGSTDTVAGALTLSDSIKARLAFPSCSWLMASRIVRGPAVAGRSFWGCGISGSVDGPRLNINSSNTGKLDVQMYHSGGSLLSLGTSAAAPLGSFTGSHLALAFDGPARRAYLWVNGAADLSVFDRALSAMGAVTWPSALRWGGAAANNAQASSWRDAHLLAWQGRLPEDIDGIVARLADARGYRLTTGDC